MSDEKGGSFTDLTGMGKVFDSEIAKKAYEEGLSAPVKAFGEITTDFLRTIHLIAAPFQLASAWQERLKAFCERIKSKVPEKHQQEAPPEIAKPVIEALQSTSDNSPLMGMFEELMAKAIDKRESLKLSPEFAGLIKNLSPLEAKLIFDLKKNQHLTDHVHAIEQNLITEILASNVPFQEYGGSDHHLTICQALQEKKLVTLLTVSTPAGQYPQVVLPPDHTLRRSIARLSMFGKWFADCCVK